MSKPLGGHVKKEIRILGLDTCSPRATIGAVVRGGLYLDGILTFSKELTMVHLAKAILETKYYPEVRLIMVHDPKRNLRSKTIQEITNLQILRISSADDALGLSRSKYQWASSKGVTGDPTLDSKSLGVIFRLTQTRGRLPEPVRIAHLLAKLAT
jgi:endonuclease V-like protein UPF0215 family